VIDDPRVKGVALTGGVNAARVLAARAGQKLKKWSMDVGTIQGPLSTEAALLQALQQVDNAVAHGAELLIGRARIDRSGSFMHPTILTGISPDNPA
jgi:acyl-CoA reductase-like NAD-dependent aldehyde dehydrogenase